MEGYIGKIVEVSENGYYGNVGYKTEPPMGNTVTGYYNGWVGENSFELVEVYDIKSYEGTKIKFNFMKKRFMTT